MILLPEIVLLPVGPLLWSFRHLFWLALVPSLAIPVALFVLNR